MSDPPDGFLARWSRRKLQAQGGAVPAPLPPEAARPAEPAQTVAEAPPAPPRPTMDDVAALTPASDFSRFVDRQVDSHVRNAALKKLFADPHFNVMDGLDTYIEDFGRADPLPAAMLRQMAQAQFLGLFAAEPQAPPSSPAADEDPDLPLQPDDAAGHPGAEPDAGGDAGRQR